MENFQIFRQQCVMNKQLKSHVVYNRARFIFRSTTYSTKLNGDHQHMATLHPEITFQVNLHTVDWESHLPPDRYREDQDGAIADINAQALTRSAIFYFHGVALKHGEKFTLYGQEAMRMLSLMESGKLPIVQCQIGDDINCVPDIGGEADVNMTATAIATMLPQGAVVVDDGGSEYSVSDVLDLVGGTFSTVAQITVDTVGTIAGQNETHFDLGGEPPHGTFTGGADYNVNDTITLSDGTVVTVAAVDNGAVTEFDITTSSTSGNDTNGATLTQDSTSGGGSGFTLTLAVGNQAVFGGSYVQDNDVNVGEYSVVPTNPVASEGGGNDDATFIVGWGVRNVTVIDGGNNYASPPEVSFTGAGGTGATAVAVLDGDTVDAIIVTNSGSGFTVTATVVIAAP
jgi:hypothetical protein